ncbi:MAG: guanylate kinase [Chloroflexota bacterium]|nr:MAG: guanylate kinase [Chloroflexota bacterium]
MAEPETAPAPRPGDAPAAGSSGAIVAARAEPVEGAPGALLVIISGPSGVGKDTIIAALRERHPTPDYHYVVTCTTRAPRPGEIPGVSYHFLSPAEFAALREAGGLLEANEVHGNWYGTPRAEVARALAAGRDVILKIDVQGAAVVKERVPDALLVFVVPPSLEELFQRLRSRATESVDELELRQRNAALELARKDDYDYVVVNETGQVERTAAMIDEIVRIEKRKHPTRRIRV